MAAMKVVTRKNWRHYDGPVQTYYLSLPSFGTVGQVTMIRPTRKIDPVTWEWTIHLDREFMVNRQNKNNILSNREPDCVSAMIECEKIIQQILLHYYNLLNV